MGFQNNLFRIEMRLKRLNPIPRTLNPVEEGQALVIAVLTVGVLLSIALALFLLFTPKIKTSSEIKKSPAAIYAAESAIEWCLYVNRHDGSAAQPVMSNGASFINGITNQPFAPADCSAAMIRAVGTYQGISRSFEISL